MRAHPEVLLVRAEIWARAEKWDIAAELADKVTDLLPKEFAPWLLLAESLHRMGRSEDAYETLVSIAAEFVTEPELHYRLAQYATAMGQLKVAYEALCMAFQQSGDDPKLKERALNDKALEPFWLDIRDMG